ncbi:sugar kinase [Ectobacillus funiculus]|uniref:Sugar kinase n=1 Tax=Ectobacillus funiculus TaxID=137993 RepID=A0ABV5W9T1_9BACI
MTKLDVVTFGEAMAMFIANEVGSLHNVQQYTRSLAGAETNTAIGFSRLGLQAGWVSKVGDDAFGKYIAQALQKECVNIEQVLVDSRFPTGFQLKSKVTAGDPEVQYFRKGSAANYLSVDDFNEEYFLSARHLHMSGIPLAISAHTREFAKHALRFMKKAGKTVSFDPNLRPSLWNSKEEMIQVTNEIAFQSDYVLPGIAEGRILTGHEKPEDIAAFYLEQGVKLVVIKLGEKGAFYQTAQKKGMVAGYKVEHVIDTVGAGDGFAVGVISALLEGLSEEESVVRGNAIGALAVQSAGDSDGYPNRERLEGFINQILTGVR